MSKENQTLRICDKGHRYFKSSDCPTCPQCEGERIPKNGFLTSLAAPARRALESKNILTPKDLTRFTENEILEFHGIGKTTILKLKNTMYKEGFQFKDNIK